MKKYWINEGRHFDISDEMRQAIENAGLKFYHQYKGERSGKEITLFIEHGNSSIDIEWFEVVTVPYDPTVFVV